MKEKHIGFLLIIIFSAVIVFFQYNKENENDYHQDQRDFLNENNQQVNQESEPTVSQAPASNGLDDLKKLNGKYPSQAKLFDNDQFISRLIAVIGVTHYNYIRENCSVETPIISKNNTFIAEGCQTHNCGLTNYIIVLDFTTDVMSVGIKFDEGAVQTYSENGSYSEYVTEWANRN